MMNHETKQKKFGLFSALTRWTIGLLLLQKNKEQSARMICAKSDLLTGLLLMLFGFYPRLSADPRSAGFVLQRRGFSSSGTTASWSWNSRGAVWYSELFYFAAQPMGQRSVCLTSVSGSEEAVSVAGVEVEGLFAGSSLNGLSLAGEKRNSSGTSSSA